MSPCKRALLYLCRERKRTLRLTLLFLALTVLMLLCGWVQASMAQNASQLRQRVGAYFRVSDDAEGRYINDALIEQLKQGGNIRRVSGENLQIMYSESILPVPGMLAARDDPARYMMSYYSGHYSSLEQHFTTGEFTLSVGRHITPADRWAAVISRPLAERNGLVPGDTFTVCHTPERAAEDPSLADGQFHFTIVGIFDIAEAQPSPAQSEPSMPENSIFIDAAAGHAIDSGDPTHSRYRYGAIFLVDDPRMLADTVAQVEQRLDPAHHTVTVDDSAYRRSVQPLERMETLMKILVAALFAAGTVVAALVLFLWIRQRTKEIGIYVSIGCSKRNILLQLVTESVLCACVSFAAAIPLAALLTAVIQHIASASQMLPAPPVAAAVSAMLIMLASAVVATLASAVYLLRLPPRRILTILS